MRYILSFTCVMLWAVCAAMAESVTLNAPSAVAAGQRFRVEVSVDGPSESVQWPLDNPGLEILYGPTSSTMSQTQIVGGKMSSTYTTTFTYTLLAKEEGTYQLPAAKCQVEGKTLTSGTATLKVLPPDEPNKDTGSTSGGRNSDASAGQGKFNKDDVHLELSLNKSSAYEGEPIVATLKVYFRNCDLTNVSEVKLPDFKGFISQELEQGARQQVTLERYKGANYSMYPLAQWLLFPQTAGEQTIDAATLTATLQYVVVRRSGGFFDFPMQEARNVQAALTAPARKVSVKALPAGKPASYLGGVGDFSVKAELTSDHVRANDAVIYRLVIEGTGNLKYLSDPQPDFPSDFEVYDPKTDMQASTTAQGVRGKRIIEYTVIPRFGGTFTIPPVEFSYFDIKSGKYRTQSTDAFQLEVEKGSDAAQPGAGVTDFSGTQQERIRQLGSDIRYLHTIEGSTFASGPIEVGASHEASVAHRDGRLFFRSLGWWLFILVPLAVFVALAIYYRRQLKLNADSARRSARKAGRVASRRLKSASAALKAGQEQPFYEALHNATQGYVADKLNIPLSELGIESMREALGRHSVGQETIDQLTDLIQTCEFARYAPSGDATARQDLYKQAAQLLSRLEAEIK